MASPITSLFAPVGTMAHGRKDPSLDDVISQLGDFKGFSGISTEGRSESPTTVPTTLTFTPCHGSTCLSLYPRTRTFTYVSSLSPTTCNATCDQQNHWRITVLEPETSDLGGAVEKPKYTLERLSSDDSEPLEVFKRCSVSTEDGMSGRRMSRAGKGGSVDYGRRLSVGHFSSGLGGGFLPTGPVT
ncbi:hypothetical protein E6O75_ATG01166 [Venturia nashicola]|uniref:Uncharacterized protein n=1 Tax=Venturia nashicola TaxID=86259 RepID=A0A4Z1PDP8_9PEZI|nr:hypothetical protein E6O75_ATG01166 [Venturia nashicola]